MAARGSAPPSRCLRQAQRIPDPSAAPPAWRGCPLSLLSPGGADSLPTPFSFKGQRAEGAGDSRRSIQVRR